MSTPPYPAHHPPHTPPVASTPRPKGSPVLGIVAFVAGVIAVVAGSAMNFVAGLHLVAVAIYDGNSDAPFASFPAEIQEAAGIGGLLTAGGFLAMALFGVWAIAQGIVATVKNRGRGWAITAIVLGVIGFLPVALALPIGMAAGAASA